MRTEDEIRDQMNEAADNASHQGKPSKWPDMSYEDGVMAALGWVLDEDESPPMSDDGESGE